MDVKFKVKDKILVIAPHQDDETIGCGGLLAKYGKQCEVLLLTDGRYGVSDKYQDSQKLVSIRKKELQKALSYCNVKKIHYLDIEDSTVRKNINVLKSFDIKPYDYIFIPNRDETHSDHNCVLHAIKCMKFKQKATAQIYEYEAWTPLRTPTWFLDISDVMKTKEKMLKAFTSQLADRDYLNTTIGLNAYRGLFINTRYAEAYMNSNYSDFKGKIYNLLPDSIKQFIIKLISK